MSTSEPIGSDTPITPSSIPITSPITPPSGVDLTAVASFKMPNRRSGHDRRHDRIPHRGLRLLRNPKLWWGITAALLAFSYSSSLFLALRSTSNLSIAANKLSDTVSGLESNIKCRAVATYKVNAAIAGYQLAQSEHQIAFTDKQILLDKIVIGSVRGVQGSDPIQQALADDLETADVAFKVRALALADAAANLKQAVDEQAVAIAECEAGAKPDRP